MGRRLELGRAGSSRSRHHDVPFGARAPLDVALDTISPNHKAILILRESEGLSYDEISRVLRIPTGTVTSRLFHARMRLSASAPSSRGS